MLQKIRKLPQRIIIIIILIILQCIMWVLLLSGIVQSGPIFNLLARLISGGVILFLINKDEEAGYKMMWILLIFITPLFGGITYIIFGDKNPSKKLKSKILKQSKNIPNQENTTSYEDVPKLIKSQLHYIEKEGFPVHGNTQTTYYKLGEDNFDALLEDLKKAKHFIFMEYFIVDQGQMLDQLVDILERKVKEGVEVRFMYDGFGTLLTLPRDYDKVLKAKGIQAVAFNPIIPTVALVMNNRDHRKITVIDGCIGYTGGINIADEYINLKQRFGHWKDTGIRLEGNAVWNLTTMFLSTWHAWSKTAVNYDKYHPRFYQNEVIKSDGIIVPYGDSPLDNSPVGQDVYLNIINQASDYLYICTPYLIINETLQAALILASKRGVDVRICTPGIPDKKLVFRVTRTYYEPLIDAGVKIYEYTPGFLHAKSFVCDDIIATVGTINMDYRSLFLHFECGVYLYQTSTIKDIKDDFLNVIDVSQNITKEMVVKGRFKGFLESILRIFAPLL